MEVEKEIIDILKCQECLNSLEQKGDNLVCTSCRLEYPISNNLIFMGYDAEQEHVINEIIEEEKGHQSNIEELQAHFDFARSSFKIALLAIPILKEFTQDKNPIAIDIGSGGAPFSKMLTENGFNTFRLELDPNSLYSGLFYDHPKLGVGKHIASDASLLPFANSSVDVVFCKEFIHHIKDYQKIFAEINRVLKKGGIFLMIEPTNKFSFLRSQAENDSINRPGHHLASVFQYFNSLKKNAFEIERYYLYHYKRSKRFKIINKLKDYYINQIKQQKKTSTGLIFPKMLIQRIVSGQNVVFAKKAMDSKYQAPRPKVKTIKPSQLTINELYLNDPRLDNFNKILADVKLELA